MKESGLAVGSFRVVCAVFAICANAGVVHGQAIVSRGSGTTTEIPEAMQERVSKLENEVAELRAIVKQTAINFAYRLGLVCGLGFSCARNVHDIGYPSGYPAANPVGVGNTASPAE